MADLRLAPLPDHQQYFLDCAVEGYELDACTHAILRLYGDPDEIGTVLAPPGPAILPCVFVEPTEIELRVMLADSRGRLQERYAKCDRLGEIAAATLRRLDPVEAGGLAYHGLVEIPSRVTELAEILAMWAVTDATVGGCLKDFKRGRRQRLDRHDEPPPRLARRLRSPRFIRNYIRHADAIETTERLRAMVGQSITRARAAEPARLRSRYGDIVRLMARQREEERRRDIERFVAARRQAPLPPTEQQRRIMRRSAATAESVVGAETVGAFIRGQDVELPGERVTLVLARTGSLAAIGHSSIAVAVKDRDGGELGQLCVYFEKTPTLDQLTAFALHMQAGLEQEIIDSANITSLSELGREHPIFASHAAKKERMLERASSAVIGPRIADRSSWERDRDRSDRYWVRTGSIWTERLTTYCLGRDQAWVAAAIAAGRKQR